MTSTTQPAAAPPAATLNATAAAVASQDDSRVRDLFNALRTGDAGVDLEAFARAFYFLQHRNFTLLDVKDAFESSSGSNERFLSYRDFQNALTKVARARAPFSHPEPPDAELVAQLLDAVALDSEQAHTEARRLDAIRRQLMKPNVLAVLQQHMRKLVQSFQLYGEHNTVSRVADTSMNMAVDGFVDFLNAYFEYEAYFSFETISAMASEVLAAFPSPSKHADDEQKLQFPQFIELFCRIASNFHVQTLEREGAQLRKAVESCRLEFSIELLLEKMAIRVFQQEEDTAPSSSASRRKTDSTRVVEAVLPGYEGDPLAALTLDATTTEVKDEVVTMESLLGEVRKILDAASGRERRPSSGALQKRPQSVLFARLPPRKSLPADKIPRHDWHFDRDEDDASKDRELPQMTLIREVFAPPQLPSNILKRLEYALTYQNTGQFHMALGALHKCQLLYDEWCSSNSEGGGSVTEAKVFFTAMVASVYDSARNDLRALTMYVDAMKASHLLPLQHVGRALVLSCLGCFLYYQNELVLARRCHEQVLSFRRKHHEIGESHVDTATAMNNLACCLSQDVQGHAVEEAYLYLKTAKRIFSERFGPSHPRVQTVARNFERVLVSQRMVVADPMGAIARGEYAHVIPGSRFQIKALVPVAKEKAGGGGKKKKKKGGKGGKKKK